MVSLRQKYPLENRKIIKKTISRFLSSLFIVVFLGFFISFSGFYTSSIIQVILFLLPLIFILFYLYEYYYFKTYFYDLQGKNIVIRKGVFSISEITLPINRLQDVYIDQDLLDRLFGLYDVHVSSATAISTFLSHIDGVNQKNSEILKKLILKGIHKRK